MNNFKTLSELLIEAAKFNNPRVLNYKKNEIWKSFSSQEFLQNSFYFACALREMGFKKGQTFANFSYQNPIWLMVDFGALLAGATTVPIFHNISKENLFYQIDDANCDFIFVDNLQNLQYCQEKSVKNIIVESLDFKGLIDFDGMILLGKENHKKYDIKDFVNSANPQDLATIIYTSGSTGKPKGVELTHDNLVSQIKATQKCFPLDKSDKVLSFLPLAHIFERMVMSFYITQNVEIYFANDVKNVGVLLKEVRPSLMTVVPRVLEKTFAKIKENVENSDSWKKIIAQKALKYALNKYPNKYLIKYLFDNVVYKKFREALGGNIKMLICGGAPLSQEMEVFYKNIGINLYCGYGLTETSPVLAVNYKNSYKFGTVGKSFPGVELKIAPDQELLARGSGVMRGYHNQPQKTAEVFEDGWFKTGDLAQIDDDGFVKITGRKKELFKTANGKYVRPIPIEQKIMQEIGFLIGALIIAEGKKFTATLLFPDFDLIEKFKKKFNFEGANQDFLKSEILQKFVDGKILQINQGLDNAEKIKKFAIIDEEVSIENGAITPSMKLKRGFLEEKYRDVIDGFYL